MSLRVISIGGPAQVRWKDRAVVIVKEGVEVGRAILEEVAAIVLDGPDILVTHQLLAACADSNVAVVVTDDKHLPNGLLLPLAGHSLHTATLRAQIDSSKPSQKRAWQSIVRAKISAQAEALDTLGNPSRNLRRLVPMVRSGDPDNLEAQAAARYFECLFGYAFVRDREGGGLNAMLNYGYAVVRSAVARAVVGAGLHAAIGIHHRNQYNPLCLADDAMEPYRPLVDYRVARLVADGDIPDALTPQIKRSLVQVIGSQVRIGDQMLPFLIGMERYAASLRRAICEGQPLAPPAPVFPPPG